MTLATSTPLLVVDSPVTPGPSALVPRISLRGRGTAPPPPLPSATGLVGSGAFVPSFAAMARSPGRHRGNSIEAPNGEPGNDILLKPCRASATGDAQLPEPCRREPEASP